MKLQVKILLLVSLIAFGNLAIAQAPKKLDAAEIKQALNKLEVLGAVLYVAAHPDDENTRLIAYMANERKLRTAYMAMTRGDGGQNLVGTDIREYLGIIRTQELLAARRKDGGEQFFTRTNDFGFSKDPDETFNTWDKDDALADVVWNIRRFKPDVIITRFDTTRVPGGRMHGHHTASALLAMEAFDIANDPKAYPEQLQYVTPWQPKGLYWNTYNFGGNNTGSLEGEPGYYEVDLGEYNELLGMSYDEISAISRSQHKSQGFGSTGRRGELREYVQLWKGKAPKGDIFNDIDQTWNRVAGGKSIGALIAKANKSFSVEDPSAIVPDLMKARTALLAIKDEYWKNVKMKELDMVIKSAMGLYLEVTASSFSAVPGEEIGFSYEVVNRSKIAAKLNNVRIPSMDVNLAVNSALGYNQSVSKRENFTVKPSTLYSQPYWLKEDASSVGMYKVTDQQMRGLAENPASIKATFDLEIDGTPYQYETDVVFKRNDRVKGEFYRPFVITPPVMADIKESVLVFPDNLPKVVNVVVKSGRSDVKGTVRLNLPQGWKSNPESVDYDLKGKNEELSVEFSVLPPAAPEEAYIGVQATYNGQTYDRGLKVLDYDHIPIQTIFPKSNTKVVRVDIKRTSQYVGYIMGSGDAIPESLEQVGYNVTILDPNSITAESLEAYDAVIVGVRAYNTIERMSVVQPRLMEYVNGGGTVITQYNTSMRNQPAIGPYPFSISRDRVTVEEADVTILAPDHPIINGPNKITQKDFEGWVQERGLYFPNEWDDKYTPILSSNDPGETPKNGGLLVAEYGEGFFIYSGYSWFRELPAGVPGAFRIFTNMISLGKEKPKSTTLNSVENKKK